MTTVTLAHALRVNNMGEIDRERERERERDFVNTFSLQNSLEGEVINPEFVVFNDTGQRFELLMKVSF